MLKLVENSDNACQETIMANKVLAGYVTRKVLVRLREKKVTSNPAKTRLGLKHRYLIHRREASTSPWLSTARNWEGTSTVHLPGELLPRPCPEYDWDGSQTMNSLSRRISSILLKTMMTLIGSITLSMWTQLTVRRIPQSNWCLRSAPKDQ